MTQWKRWQDYVTMVFGVLLFISPLVFGETSHHTSTYGAYVLGVLLLASGIVASATKEPRRSLIGISTLKLLQNCAGLVPPSRRCIDISQSTQAHARSV